jgi:hypothetical protein
MTKRRGPGEGFSFENGRWTDAGFHEAMFEGADHTGALRAGRLSGKQIGFTDAFLDEIYGPEIQVDRAYAKSIGLTEEEIDKIFGPESK